MDWQQYAAHLDTEVKTLEETVAKLKQEVRGLQRQLIEAQPQNDLSKHLGNARQEAATDKHMYIHHLNRLQQQLDNANAGQKEALDRLKSVDHEVQQAKAGNQRPKAMPAATTKAQAQPPQGSASPEEKQKFNTLSWQDRCAVLERQLKIQQTENARLQNLNDRSSLNKLAPFDNGEDDEELQIPNSAAPRIKQEPKGTPRSSTAVPPETRPTNHARRTQAGTIPSHAASKNTGTAFKLSAAHTYRGNIGLASKPTLAASSAQGSRAASTIDLEADTRLPATPATKSARANRLPVRSSIHDNVTVADYSLPAPYTPTPSSKAVPPLPNVSPIQPSTTQLAAGTPATKCKRKVQEPASNPRTKRRRSKEDELQDEVANLTINALGFGKPTTPRNKRRKSYQESDAGSDFEDGAFQASMDFRFTAICKYDDNGEISGNYTSEELVDVVAALWERIHKAEDQWERTLGEDWQWEFKKPRKTSPPACVTQKCRKKPTVWGVGVPAGKYACVECVGTGKPCFTFVPGRQGGFRLLPLSAKDRMKGVTTGTETRYWINDEKPAGDAGERKQS